MDATASRRATLRAMEVVSICPLRAGSVLRETAGGALTIDAAREA
jgi:hypothetical protein